MRPKGLSPAFHSVLALAALALVFPTNAAAVSPNGANPIGNLVADAAGNLYGATACGGEHGYGAVFQLARKPDGKWVETLLHSFDGNFGSSQDGGVPSGGLTFDTSGNLYVVMVSGGEQACDWCGTVFEFMPVAGGKWDLGRKIAR